MRRWKLKACPRCGGDIFPDWAQYVLYEHCLQCGYSSVVQQNVFDLDGNVNKDNLKQAEESVKVK